MDTGRRWKACLSGWVWQFWVYVVFLFVCAAPALAASYVYDSDGRLRAVTSSTGSSSAYVYDALGNLVRVVSVPANQLAVFAFIPNSGSVGTTVTIFGSGFSLTPASDVVKFNGTQAATPTSATATQLVVKVPSSATTGTISVTVGSNTATSTDIFTVVSAALNDPPTITSFNPAIVVIGNIVSVVGTNLQPIVGQSAVRIGGQVVPQQNLVFGPIAGHLSITVPGGIGSGPISVTTPFGQATTKTDLLVVPSGIAAGSVQPPIDIAVDGPSKSLNLASPNQVGAFLFGGQSNSWISFQISSLTYQNPQSQLYYQLFDPFNGQVAAGYANSAALSFHLPQLRAIGGYSLYFTPGNATLQLTGNLETNPVLPEDGTATSVSTSINFQSKRLIFAGFMGQNLGFGLRNLTFSPGNTLGILQFYLPSGATPYPLNYCYSSSPGGGCEVDLVDLTESGQYSVVVWASTQATMSFQAYAAGDATGTLSGAPIAVNLSNGQNGRYALTGSGSSLGLQLANLSVQGGVNVTIALLDANGNTITSWPAANGTQQLGTLTGPYTIFVDPAYAATASMQLTLVAGGQN